MAVTIANTASTAVAMAVLAADRSADIGEGRAVPRGWALCRICKDRRSQARSTGSGGQSQSAAATVTYAHDRPVA
jgi:hypothetical protein